MKTTATTPRKWRNVYLTRNEWDKLRPAIKAVLVIVYHMDSNHECSGINPFRQIIP